MSDSSADNWETIKNKYKARITELSEKFRSLLPEKTRTENYIKRRSRKNRPTHSQKM